MISSVKHVLKHQSFCFLIAKIGIKKVNTKSAFSRRKRCHLDKTDVYFQYKAFAISLRRQQKNPENDK